MPGPQSLSASAVLIVLTVQLKAYQSAIATLPNALLWVAEPSRQPIRGIRGEENDHRRLKLRSFFLIPKTTSAGIRTCPLDPFSS